MNATGGSFMGGAQQPQLQQNPSGSSFFGANTGFGGGAQ